MWFSSVGPVNIIDLPDIPGGKNEDEKKKQEEEARQRELERVRRERAEKKRKEDAEKRDKERDPDSKPGQQTGSFFERGQDEGIRDDNPYGLPGPLGEKGTRAGERPQPWDHIST